jgi:hypothetical protein
MVAERCKLPLQRQHSSRSLLDRRHVHRHQWQMLRKLQSNLMEPQDFYAKWDVTHKQIASICLCCENTVSNWFIHTPNRREASLIHKFILGLIDKDWSDLSKREENN